MSEELKACPFCGKQEVEIVIEHGCETLPNYKKFYFTNCKNCGSLIDSYRIIDELVAHFNTRPIEDALQSEIARLTAENARLIEENTKWKRLVDMKNDALDSYAEFYNSCLSVCGMDVDTNPCTEADEIILETLRKGVKYE